MPTVSLPRLDKRVALLERRLAVLQEHACDDDAILNADDRAAIRAAREERRKGLLTPHRVR